MSSSNLPFYLFTGNTQSTSFSGGFSGFADHYVDEREQFLKKLADERLAREKNIERKENAVKIQRCWRGYAIRNKIKCGFREEFDHIFNVNYRQSDKKIDEPTLIDQIKRLNFFFDPRTDLKRAAQLIANVKSAGILSRNFNNDKQYEYNIGTFLICCIKYLSLVASSTTSLADPLRCIEMYFSSNNIGALTVKRMLRGGYFDMLKILSKHRLPNDLVEETTRPPTILSESVYNFYLYPLISAESLKNNENLKSYIIQQFLMCFSKNLTLLDRYYFLPAFGQNLLFNEIGLSFMVDHDDSLFSIEPKNKPEFVYVILYLMAHCSTRKSIKLSVYAVVLSKVLTMLKDCINFRHDEKDVEMETDDGTGKIDFSKEILSLCNSPKICGTIISLVEKSSGKDREEIFMQILRVCEVLVEMQEEKTATQKHSFLMALSLIPSFLNYVWNIVTSLEVSSISGNASFIYMLTRSSHFNASDRKRCLPILRVFCEMFANNLRSAADNEIQQFGVNSSTFPFDKKQLIKVCGVLRDIGMGLIELALPDSRPAVAERYREVLLEMGADLSPDITAHWNMLFKSVVELLQLLHQCDQRLKFCPRGHWSVRNSIALQHASVFKSKNRDRNQLFRVAQYLSRQELVENKEQILAPAEMRTMTILRNVPFLIPFEERVTFLYQLTIRDKEIEGRNGVWNPGVQVNVNRPTIYEDSFAALSPESMPNLKKLLRVSMRNWAGATEAGIDGGGIFREFISELLKAGFDPARGLFRSTHNNQLYPNYLSRKIFPDNFRKHFYFLGRILGKLIYENQLSELPLAKFFLSRLLNRYSNDVEIHHLESYDPVLYRNLISLKSSDIDVSQLDLDFSVMVEEFGAIEIVNLKPNGRNIPVTKENKLEYVQLVTNFYLDTQIQDQINAFCDGISDLIDLDWLHMFDPQELQVIISGVDKIFAVDDLRSFAVYQGDYDDNIIGSFWEAVRSFTDEQKRKLLKFVTGCSRPPLLGFKDLNPPFTIQFVPADNQSRLPTAATCMNLLKLPKFKDPELLRQKLSYAIEAEAGFELS